MINLLPQRNMLELRREYRLRLVTVSLIFLVLIEVFSVALIAPTYILALERERSALERRDTLKRQTDSKFEERLTSLLKVTTEKVKVLEPKESLYVFEGVEKILGRKPAGVKLSQVVFERTDGRASIVALRGQAEKREDLQLFAARLEQEKALVEKVELPFSHLLEEKDIAFQLRIMIKL